MSINKVILIGHLGKDPEVRRFTNGDPKTSFSLATSSSWKDKNTGERKQQTEWHNIEAFGSVAAICEQYLKKGSHVYIEGRLKTEKYMKDNIERYITKIILEKMQMLDGKDKASDGGGEPNGNVSPQGNNFDDDIPF